MEDNSQLEMNSQRPSFVGEQQPVESGYPAKSMGESESRCGFTLIWKIENAGLLEVEDPWWGIESPVFSPRSLGEKRFRLYLYLKEDYGEGEHLTFYMFQRDEPLDFPRDIEWSFIDCNGSPIFGGTVQNHGMKEMEGIYLPGCPTFEEVFVTRKSEFLSNDTLTLRCRIWKSGGDLSNNEFILCRSRYELVKDSFLWPICDFSSLELNQEVATPVKFEFSCGSCEFKLKFTLKGSSLEDASANVELVADAISWDVKVLLKVSVCDHEEKVLKSTGSIREIFDKDSKYTWVLPEFVSKKELLGKKSDCLRNDVLTLFCEFTTRLNLCSHSLERKYFGPLNLINDNLNENFTST